MGASSAVNLIKSDYEALKKCGENTEVYDFFAASYGSGFLSAFNPKDHDSEWQKVYSKEKSGKGEYSSIKSVRRKIAYCGAGLRDYKSFYLSGSDDHTLTDVDVFRVAPHFIQNAQRRIEVIAQQLG